MITVDVIETSIRDYKLFHYFEETGIASVNDLVMKNFSHIGLAKERIMVDGELITINYYEGSTIDPITGQEIFYNKILKESRTYTRDIYGLLVLRTLTIDFLLKDETIGANSIATKTYSFKEKLTEIRTRRQNIINSVSEYVFYTLGFANAVDILSDTENEQDMYIKGVEGSPLETKVQNSTKIYMTQTIKDTIVGMLDYT